MSRADSMSGGRQLSSFLAVALACWGAVLGGPVAHAQPVVPREYELKAVFLFNFLQFVDWPPAAFPTAESPLRIGVLGDNPFGRALEDTVRGELARGRKVTVQHARRVSELRECQLLFIAASERGRIAEIMAELGDAPVLTVGELPDFATRRGGAVNFFFQQNKLRFEINVAEAQRRGLKLSSQLLSLAKIVGPSPAIGRN